MMTWQFHPDHDRISSLLLPPLSLSAPSSSLKEAHLTEVSSLTQVLHSERQASDSDSGPTADGQPAAPGRDNSDSLSRFSPVVLKKRH